MLVSPAVLTPIRAIAKAKVVRVDFTIISRVELSPMFTLYHGYTGLIYKASLIMIEGNQLPVATIAASLAILLSSAGVAQMPKMLGCEFKVMAITAVC